MTPEQIKAKMTVSASGCWLWQGSVSPEGYGRSGGRYIHRLSYEAFVGDIPQGHQIDHLCRVRLCCNPEHLEPVTQIENILRGSGATAQHAKKTKCIRGHEFDGVRKTNSSTGVGRTCSRCIKAARKRHKVAISEATSDSR